MFKLTKERYESEENITKRLFDSPIFRLNEENIDDISFPCFKTSFTNIQRKNKFEIKNSSSIIKNEKLTISNKFFELAIFNVNDNSSEKKNNYNNMDSENKYIKDLTSKENYKIITKKFNTRKIYKIKRIDYAIKHFKVYLSKFLRNYGNNLIQNSILPLHLKYKKLFLPNYNSFTGNTKEQDNYDFLNFTVGQIFGYFKENEQKNTLQIKNINFIAEILNYIKNNEKSYQFYDIIEFFHMSIEQAIIMFYNSIIFREYFLNPKTIELDIEFRRQKKFSLLDKYGFIKFAKIGNKNI